MANKVFRFSMEYEITGVDEQDAIDNFQEILNEANTQDASNWHVKEVKDGEAE